MRVSLNKCPLKNKAGANKSFVDTQSSLEGSGKFDRYIQDALSRKSNGSRLGRKEVDQYNTINGDEEYSLELLEEKKRMLEQL
jgi:hypothetical protein